MFDDKRVPLESDNTARIAMLVVVFPDAGMARRCANSFVYQSTHSPSDPSNLTGPHIPYKVVDSTTVEMHTHAPGSGVFPEDTGDYNTMLAQGRVFGLGFSHNMLLPRNADQQETVGREVSLRQAEPGDLVCYGDHIAIWTGEGQIVHASQAQGEVVHEPHPKDLKARVRTVRRVYEPED